MLKERDGLDREALDRLQRIGGPGLAARMIDAFLESAPGRLARARDAVAALDLDGIQAALHSLVSSAGQLGGKQLERALIEGQRELQATGMDSAATVLENVEAAFDRFRDHLAEFRKSLTP